MSAITIVPRLLGVLAILAALMPTFIMRAQDEAASDGMATGHAQVIAHGVARMPGERIAWQVGLSEAGQVSRASAAERPVGFLLAEDGAIAVTDDQGEVLQRLTPGEAVWTEPGAPRAVVGLDDRRNDFYHIGLVASHGGGESVSDFALTHDAFPAPAEHAIAVELMRGVLDRAEEHDIAGNAMPMLLLVTRGKVFLETGAGDILQLSRGESVQLDAAAVVVGASRAPAAYVVARIGPSVPQVVRLSDASAAATPTSPSGSAATAGATPVAAPHHSTPVHGEGQHGLATSLVIAIRACPAGMSPGRFVPDVCEAAPPGTTLSLRRATSTTPLGVAQALPDAWAWADLDPGSYDLDVNAFPEGFAIAALDGQPCCGIDEHDSSLLIPESSETVRRTLYLFPPAVPREIELTIDVLACPPGMTPETLLVEWCEAAPPGTILTLREWERPVGVAALSANVWTWQGLGPLDYRLQVNAMPEGFASYQLGQEPCCSGAGEIAINLATAEGDAQRTLYLFRPPDPADAAVDADEDGVIDTRETELGTHPFLSDSDDDGIVDGEERDLYGTDPLRSDTDGDGLEDAGELLAHGTNPLLADTDGDGAGDAQEIAAASDPLDGASLPATPTPLPTATPQPTPTALPLATVTRAPATPEPSPVPHPTAARSPLAATPRVTPPGTRRQPSPETALDGDGLATLAEITIHRTSPIRADTDGDGINDGDEVAAGTNPLDDEGG